MKKNAHEFNKNLEETQKSFKEEERRIVLQEAISHLKQSYDALVKRNVEEKLKKRIKL